MHKIYAFKAACLETSATSSTDPCLISFKFYRRPTPQLRARPDKRPGLRLNLSAPSTLQSPVVRVDIIKDTVNLSPFFTSEFIPSSDRIARLIFSLIRRFVLDLGSIKLKRIFSCDYVLLLTRPLINFNSF